MEKIKTEWVGEAKEYVQKLLSEKLSEKITFHTIEHAGFVVANAEQIGKNSKLSEEEIRLVMICAWFHDVGYISKITEHENVSAAIAEKFLKSKNADEQTINLAKSCILSTRIPQQPKNLISKVLCDADMAHLADENYFENIEKMRQEWNNTLPHKYNKRYFHQTSARFFSQHQYFTNYAQQYLQPQKEINMQQIQNKINMANPEKEKKHKTKKIKSKNYSRGVESMFRNTARMQINLSSIADKKSNILISVNAIMISITMTVLVSRFEETPNIILPTLIFLFFSLVTIVFAILSTRPHVSSGTFDKQKIKQNKVNLLFFGNFYNMKLEDYEWALGELMKNEDLLYSTMILDQYSLGKVLAKKYKLLRVAYNVFMFGIIISVLFFVFAFINI